MDKFLCQKEFTFRILLSLKAFHLIGIFERVCNSFHMLSVAMSAANLKRHFWIAIKLLYPTFSKWFWYPLILIVNAQPFHQQCSSGSYVTKLFTACSKTYNSFRESIKGPRIMNCDPFFEVRDLWGPCFLRSGIFTVHSNRSLIYTYGFRA